MSRRTRAGQVAPPALAVPTRPRAWAGFGLRALAVAVAVVLGACDGADSGSERGAPRGETGSAAPAPCDATVELARAVMEGVGYAVGELAVGSCRDGRAVVEVQPDLEACKALGLECDTAWVFLEDSGESDWWSLGYVEGEMDCDISEPVREACRVLGL